MKTGEPNELGIDRSLFKRDKLGQWTTPLINVSSVDQYIAKIESVVEKSLNLKRRYQELVTHCSSRIPKVYNRIVREK